MQVLFHLYLNNFEKLVESRPAEKFVKVKILTSKSYSLRLGPRKCDYSKFIQRPKRSIQNQKTKETPANDIPNQIPLVISKTRLDGCTKIANEQIPFRKFVLIRVKFVILGTHVLVLWKRSPDLKKNKKMKLKIHACLWTVTFVPKINRMPNARRSSKSTNLIPTAADNQSPQSSKCQPSDKLVLGGASGKK